MDITPIIIQLIRSFWFLIPIIALAGILKSPWFKGVFGEFIINISAKVFLNKNDYHLVKNVTLPTLDGTTQIDHIIVSIYGVFVIETKNMKGWIFGSPEQRTWTQKIYKHSSKFQNPLHQNYKHVKTVESLFGLQESQIHSLVVFIGDSTFKTPMPSKVTSGFGYIRYIKSKKHPVLPASSVAEMLSKIESGRLNQSFKTHQEHVRHVQKIKNEKKGNIRCPRCGSSMVKRKAQKGQNTGKEFWGCSRFPRCRGTVNITSDHCHG